MLSPPPSPTRGKSRRFHPRSRRRRVVECLVFLAVGGLVLRVWCVQGVFVPLTVVSGSMAETLLGPHREVVCGDCGLPFACGADLDRLSSRAVCPNCGFAENGLAAQPDVAGDRLLVDKAVFHLRPPQRWELVAFRHPHEAAEIHVKRVVGLPGESIRIRHGDICVDGEIQRKTLLQQRAMAVLVHDAHFTPRSKPSPPPRWRHEKRETGWQSTGGGFVHPAEQAATSIDWLGYHHWRRLPGQPGQVLETPILNDRGYNQTRPQRAENTHPVPDLLLSFRLVRTFGSGQLLVRATDGGEEFLVRIEFGQNTFEVFLNGRPLAPPSSGTLPDLSRPLRLEVSLIDCQFLLGLDGLPAFVHPYDAANPPPKATSQPFAVGSRGLGVELRDLRVYRDVYYTRPIGPTPRWAVDEPVVLGGDDYFVLGDNSPISDDSRTWPSGPAVPGRLLLGRPFFVHFPTQSIDLGPWRFEVLDPARIRHVR